jgi:hypothetical protein
MLRASLNSQHKETQQQILKNSMDRFEFDDYIRDEIGSK